MEETLNNDGSLINHIEQLERERDQLHKDIEQLCMQNSSPSYIAAATPIHFQRISDLELEIGNLKKKLAGYIRDNHNLQEELSEAYRIKSQLADLHSVEVSKNMEAEKQIKFFQGCVAAAFSERDQAIMEAEKVKEGQEVMQQKIFDLENRLEELQLAYQEEKKVHDIDQKELFRFKEQNEAFERVINKFYEIRQSARGYSEDSNLEDKYACLLQDPTERWNFSDNRETATSKYIASLEEELKSLRYMVENLQNNLRVGVEMERHLKGKVCLLEEKQITSDYMMNKGLSGLRNFHTQKKNEIMNLLAEEGSRIGSMLVEVQEKMREFHLNKDLLEGHVESTCDDTECRDVHISSDINASIGTENIIGSSYATRRLFDSTDSFSQALQEKVSALLLLSQQEERHLLVEDVNIALQKKLEELQSNLFQVTDEKVKALMELAQLKRDYQLLQDSEGEKGNFFPRSTGKNNIAHGSDGKIKNLLKRTYLRRWIAKDIGEGEADSNMNDDKDNLNMGRGNCMDFARLKVEYATLQESMTNMEHLTLTVHKLRMSLLKVKEAVALPAPRENVIEDLNKVIAEANTIKTALSSSLPVSWSAEIEPECSDKNPDGSTNCLDESGRERLDPVSAAGFEMIELLILAAQFQKIILIEGFHTHV
ncbi:hypothetical protein QJS10_CPB13g00544 [Acorus calamus]|uniref:Uncharacterized protein n=1 Tax=Acorus calamus TaxID=4465 RepID=A0AAV9DFB2_ACOCL|nr:hypothetical protein QJS10_CPB13g00544 [Acorus calamus]